MKEYIKPDLNTEPFKTIKIMAIDLELDLLSDLFDEDVGVDVGD